MTPTTQADPETLTTAKRIKIARTEKGWTQKQLAEACGIDQGNISRYERGTVAPTGEQLDRIFAAIGATHTLAAVDGVLGIQGRAAGKLNIKLPDGNTDPDGQVCSACFNDYGYAVNVGTEWQRYVLPFNDLKQEPDWGAPRKPHIDRKRIYAIHFEAKVPGADYDFFIDDIAFICKG